MLLCCLPIQTGCIGEDDFADDPVGNFEQLWKIIDERYCFLDSKGIDWDAVHEKYSKLIVPGMSNDDLFDKLSEMLYILKTAMSIFHPPSVSLITMHGIRDIRGTTGKIFCTNTIWVVPAKTTTHRQV